jgi:hypothetical protein
MGSIRDPQKILYRILDPDPGVKKASDPGLYLAVFQDPPRCPHFPPLPEKQWIP